MEGDGAIDTNGAFGYGGLATSNNQLYHGAGLPSMQNRDPNKIYQAINGGNGSYISYDDYTGPDGQGKPVFGQTMADYFNPQGQYSHSRAMQDHSPWGLVAAMIASAATMGAGGALMGGAGASGGGAAGGAAGAGGGMAGIGNGAFLGEGVASGVGAWDTAAGLGAAGGGAAGAGTGYLGMNPGTYDFGLGNLTDAGIIGSNTTLGTGVQVPWTTGGMGQLGGTQALGGGLPGLLGSATSTAGAGGAIPSAGTTSSSTPAGSSLMNNPLLKQAIGPALSAMTGGGKGGGGDLGGLIGGAVDYNRQNKAAEDMLEYMRQAQARIDQLYAPGSAESAHLWEAMSRKDARSGRNSQYGTRTTDFQGQVASEKGKLTAQLAQALSPQYQAAFNKQASSTGGLGTAVGKFLNNANITDLSKLLESWFSSGANRPFEGTALDSHFSGNGTGGD